MDLDFGHGFIPRIGSQNYKAVDLCLGSNTLFDAPLAMPWAIVDAAWAEKNQEFLASLRSHGTSVLLDGSWWRYRYSKTFEVRTMATASWAPESPTSLSAPEEFRRAVREYLRAQAKLDPAAYFLPGFMPDDKHDDLRAHYELIAEVVAAFDEIPPRPLIQFVGAHSEGLGLALELIRQLPSFLSAVYVQVGPTSPVTDSPTKLLRVSDFYASARRDGMAVIAGHAGAITPALRAVGVDAADAGLASSETFETASARRPKLAKDDDAQRSGGPSSRIYLEPIDRSMNAKRVVELRSVSAVSDLLGGCRLPCHRFIGGNDFLSRAKEHSLRSRVAVAERVAGLPPSMRLDEVIEAALRRRSNVTAVNSALQSTSIAPLATQPIDNHLNWLGRLRERQTAA